VTAKPSSDPQFDLFVPYLSDLPLRDQRETMERPFFSLAKRKRLRPIDYVVSARAEPYGIFSHGRRSRALGRGSVL
jgi:hypothetical protein